MRRNLSDEPDTGPNREPAHLTGATRADREWSARNAHPARPRPLDRVHITVTTEDPTVLADICDTFDDCHVESPQLRRWSVSKYFESTHDAAMALEHLRSLAAQRCTSDDPTDHQGDTCPAHEVTS